MRLFSGIVIILIFSSNICSSKPAKSLGVGYAWERFDPALVSVFNSVQSLNDYADAKLGKQNRKTLAYANLLDSLISERFYHSYCTYSLKENWLAYLLGKYVWYDLAAIVNHEDIMKHPMAACSQQAIVLMNAFKHAGIPYRPVHLNGHFTLEGQINGNWYFFDPSIEPNFINKRKSLDALIKAKELNAAYYKEISKDEISKFFSSIDYGEINENVAWKARIFHTITYLISLLSPGFALFFILRILKSFTKK